MGPATSRTVRRGLALGTSGILIAVSLLAVLAVQPGAAAPPPDEPTAPYIAALHQGLGLAPVPTPLPPLPARSRPRDPLAPSSSPSLPPVPSAAGGLLGQATWWDSWGHGFYGAAGSRLRAALGPGYVGRWITACVASGACVRVRLTTSCACQPPVRLIDLSLDAFTALAPPSRGVILVTLSW